MDNTGYLQFIGLSRIGYPMAQHLLASGPSIQPWGIGINFFAFGCGDATGGADIDHILIHGERSNRDQIPSRGVNEVW